MKYLILSCLFSLCLLSGPVLALVSAKPQPDAPVLVITAPWLNAAAHIAEAGGRIIGPVSAPVAVLAFGDGAGFVQRLSSQNFLFVRNGRRLAEICGVVSW